MADSLNCKDPYIRMSEKSVFFFWEKIALTETYAYQQLPFASIPLNFSDPYGDNSP